jgi:hypothetical protein
MANSTSSNQELDHQSEIRGWDVETKKELFQAIHPI